MDLLAYILLAVVAVFSCPSLGTVSGPVFNEEPQDAVIRVGGTKALYCHASGSPDPVITWYHNGRALSDMVFRNRLRIYRFQSRDAGYYYCNASNVVGSVISRRASVIYHNLSDHFEKDPVSTKLYRDPLTGKLSSGTIKFSCTIHQRPFTTVPDIQWQRIARNKTRTIGNQPDGRFYHFQTGTTSYLQITNPKSSDFQGLFRCVATHTQVPAVEVLSEPARLSATEDFFYGKFGFTQQPTNLSVKVGQDAALGCAFLGEVLQFSWDSSTAKSSERVENMLKQAGHKHSNPKIMNILAETNRSSERVENSSTWKRAGYSNLQIMNVQKSDEGWYWCKGIGKRSNIMYSTRAYISVIANPVFTESLPVSVTVIAGLKLTLICQVQGVPFSQIEWLKNTVPIVFEGNSRTRKYSNGSLEIWPVEKVDGGLYQCVAENSAGNNIQSSSHVIVLYPATTTLLPQFIEIEEEHNVTLYCSAEGNPPNIMYHWMKYGGNVTADGRVTVLLNGSLQILNASPKDSGKYTCIPTNSVGTGKAGIAVLKVKQKVAEVYLEPSMVVVNATQSIVLMCNTNIPSLLPFITWHFSNGQLPETATVLGNRMLQIMPATKEDSGNYSCSINQTTKITRAEATVVVQYPPNPVQVFQQEMTVNYGQTVRLECQADALPAADIVWMKDGFEVSSIKLSENSVTLNLENVTKDMEGTYVCSATNNLGSHEQTFSLSVNEGQIQRVVVKTQSESQTTDIYIIVGAVAGAVVVVIILVVVIAVLSFCCLPQRKYDVAGAEEKTRATLSSAETESYTKTYNKTYPSVGNDTKQDVQDAPPRKHLPRSYSMASSICSGFSSNMHIPGADHNHDNDHPVETEFSSFRYDVAWHKRRSRMKRSVSQPAMPTPAPKSNRRVIMDLL